MCLENPLVAQWLGLVESLLWTRVQSLVGQLSPTCYATYKEINKFETRLCLRGEEIISALSIELNPGASPTTSSRRSQMSTSVDQVIRSLAVRFYHQIPLDFISAQLWAIKKAECQRTDAIVVLEKTLQSPLNKKEIKQPVNPKGNQP